MTPSIDSKLPRVGTTIFTVMSRKAAEHGAVNLSQGFPDFPTPARLQALLTDAMGEGLNQYSPFHGLPALRERAAGTYFQLVDYRAIADVPDTEFCERLIRDAGVAAIPISVFYERPPPEQRVVRLCFAKEDRTLDLAGERLCSL